LPEWRKQGVRKMKRGEKKRPTQAREAKGSGQRGKIDQKWWGKKPKNNKKDRK